MHTCRIHGFAVHIDNHLKISISDPNRIKEVTMDANIALTGVYAPAPEPVGDKATPINISISQLVLLAPYIGLTMLLAVAVVTVVYVKKKRARM